MPLSKSLEVYDDAVQNRWWIYSILGSVAFILGYLLHGKLVYQAALIAPLCYVVSGNRYQWVYIIYKTFRRDLKGAMCLIRILLQVKSWQRNHTTVASQFSYVAAKYPNKVAFYFEDQEWTYQQTEDFTNQIAWYFKRKGFKRGECIALVMESKPEYVFIWLGLAKIGVLSALINYNLRGDSLVYCVKVSKCKALVFGYELTTAINEIQPNIDMEGIPFFQYNTEPAPTLENTTLLSTEMLEMPTTPLTEDIKAGKTEDKILYIYTSGTTGLPKAAIITNLRYLMVPYALHMMMGISERDVIYVTLPLYHTAGGILGVGQALTLATAVVLRKKFSASSFWSDCVKYNCTVAQYIGEVCRYLLASPVREAESQHKVRLMLGNGLRPQIWRQFTKRFHIAKIGEFYGSTEGNSNLINITGHEGAVGFVSRLINASSYPLSIVRCDLLTGELVRKGDGFCIPCKPMEPGLLLGKNDPKNAIFHFAGYSDKQASKKKLVKNVFVEGDCYFNSGDVMVMDHLGYIFFKDRTGDTFRWRGENVSTAELEAVVSNIVELTDCIAYGVTVPHTEGNAGMVAITDPDKKVRIDNLNDSLKNALPSYAQPLFIRIIPNAPVTSTFKLIKRNLVKEGFNINKIKDEIYFLDPKTWKYTLLTQSIYDDIQNGSTRL